MKLGNGVLPRGLSEADRQLILDAERAAFWKWYYAHRDDIVIQRRLLVLRVRITVGDLYPLWRTIFGDPVSDAVLPKGAWP